MVKKIYCYGHFLGDSSCHFSDELKKTHYFGAENPLTSEKTVNWSLDGKNQAVGFRQSWFKKSKNVNADGTFWFFQCDTIALSLSKCDIFVELT